MTQFLSAKHLLADPGIRLFESREGTSLSFSMGYTRNPSPTPVPASIRQMRSVCRQFQIEQGRTIQGCEKCRTLWTRRCFDEREFLGPFGKGAVAWSFQFDTHHLLSSFATTKVMTIVSFEGIDLGAVERRGVKDSCSCYRSWCQMWYRHQLCKYVADVKRPEGDRRISFFLGFNF